MRDMEETMVVELQREVSSQSKTLGKAYSLTRMYRPYIGSERRARQIPPKTAVTWNGHGFTVGDGGIGTVFITTTEAQRLLDEGSLQ